MINRVNMYSVTTRGNGDIAAYIFMWMMTAPLGLHRRYYGNNIGCGCQRDHGCGSRTRIGKSRNFIKRWGHGMVQ